MSFIFQFYTGRVDNWYWENSTIFREPTECVNALVDDLLRRIRNKDWCSSLFTREEYVPRVLLRGTE
jgi:hypothetical protein